MGATNFTGWLFNFLTQCAVILKVANLEMLKAISAIKRKNAAIVVDLLRVNLLFGYHMILVKTGHCAEFYDINYLVPKAVKMQNEIFNLLMEVGAFFTKKHLYGKIV